MFNTNSASFKKTSDYILEKVYASGITEKSHSRFMKYILGVNRKASNIAVMSELERYPIYFSVILSMLKYFHRLNNLSEGLLYDAFVCNKELNSCQTNTWYSSILLILNKMNISNVNVYVGTLCNNVKKKLCDSFLSYWYNLKKCINEDKKGKLRTYFTFKEHFIREKYTFLNDFKVRQAICKIRISAHPLMIEIGRYKNLETEERLCKLCITQKIEDEYHFLIDCPIYNNSRKICYQKISELCSNFNNMSDKSKFYYLFTNEDLSIINIFGKCIIECLETRKLKQGL